MKKWIIAILVILLLCGVLFLIMRTDEQILGENYYYLPEYEAYDVGYPEGGIIYKSSEKNLFSNVIIHGNVIRMNDNKDFILALQLKNDSAKTDKKQLLHYFIIQKKSDNVYGPFQKQEYLQKREELNVPKELQLKE
jgi:hypothetical protein